MRRITILLFMASVCSGALSALAADQVPDTFVSIAEFTAVGWLPEVERGGTIGYLSRTPDNANLAADERYPEDYKNARTGFKIHIGCDKASVPAILKSIAERNNALSTEMDQLRRDGKEENVRKANTLNQKLLRYKVLNPETANNYDPKMIVVYLRPNADISEVVEKIAEHIPKRTVADVPTGDVPLLQNKSISVTFGINEFTAGDDGSREQLMLISAEDREQLINAARLKNNEELLNYLEKTKESDGRFLVDDQLLRREHGFVIPSRHSQAITEAENARSRLDEANSLYGVVEEPDLDSNAAEDAKADTSELRAREIEDYLRGRQPEIDDYFAIEKGDANDLPDVPKFESRNLQTENSESEGLPQSAAVGPIDVSEGNKFWSEKKPF